MSETFNEEIIHLNDLTKIIDIFIIELQNGKIININDHFCNSFHATKDNLIGKKLELLCDKKDFELLNEFTISQKNEFLKIHLKINNIKKIINFKVKKLDNKIYLIGYDINLYSKNEDLIKSMLIISKASFTCNSINDLYKEIHRAVNNLVDAKNFFIALYNKKNDTIEFPYFIDEKDKNFKIINASESNSLTVNVITSKTPKIFRKKEIIENFGNETELFGTVPEIWLGIPLIITDDILGAIGVQSYDNPDAYNEEDLKLLDILSQPISIVISKKINENKLKLSEEKFKVAFYTSPDAIAINRLDDGRYIEINEGFTKLTGYTPDDVKGKSSYDINIWDDFKDREKLVAGLKEKGIYENLDALFRIKDGSKKYGLMSAKLIMLDNIPHILSITRDIDEFKKTRKELEELNIELEQRVVERTTQIKDAMEELQKEILRRESIQRDLERYQKELAEALEIEKELNELKSRFISMVSHEYRTPLTVIYTSTELLKKYFQVGDYEKHNKHIERIQTAVDNMTSLLEQVLFISRTEQKRLIIQPENFNLVEFIYTIIEEMTMLDSGLHNIQLNSSKSVIEVETDKNLINQILTNLISNSIKYSFENSDIIIDLEDNIDYITIIVSDNGIGISEEDSDKIYDYFYRGSNVGIKQGTGLGLSIVKKAVESLKGMIYFSSEKNIGTTFTIKLPKKFELK